MKKTLDAFSAEWFELNAKSQIDKAELPEVPEIFKENLELSDQIAQLQHELDEARIITEKAKSTYDKLKKQKDFQKINHR